MSESSNGYTTSNPKPITSFEDLMTEMEAIRRMMLDAAARAGRLVTAMRQQRRQSRAIQTAVEAIRGLKIER